MGRSEIIYFPFKQLYKLLYDQRLTRFATTFLNILKGLKFISKVIEQVKSIEINNQGLFHIFQVA